MVLDKAILLEGLVNRISEKKWALFQFPFLNFARCEKSWRLTGWFKRVALSFEEFQGLLFRSVAIL